MVTLFCETKRTRPQHHYQDESYHKRIKPIDPGAAGWNEFSLTAFFVDAGEWSAAAQSGSALSGAEIHRAIGWGHAPRLGGVSQRGLANASDAGLVASPDPKPTQLATASARRLCAGCGGCHRLLAASAERLSE